MARRIPATRTFISASGPTVLLTATPSRRICIYGVGAGPESGYPGISEYGYVEFADSCAAAVPVGAADQFRDRSRRVRRFGRWRAVCRPQLLLLGLRNQTRHRSAQPASEQNGMRGGSSRRWERRRGCESFVHGRRRGRAADTDRHLRSGDCHRRENRSRGPSDQSRRPRQLDHQFVPVGRRRGATTWKRRRSKPTHRAACGNSARGRTAARACRTTKARRPRMPRPSV